MSTKINGIYMLSVPTIFEGNNKLDSTTGPFTTFKNWASELQIYKSLEDHNLIDIMDNVKRQTMPIYDDSFIDQKLDKQNLLRFEADRRRGTKLRRLMDEYSATNKGAPQRNEELKR
eukprot:3695516-Amphidinium_carterae.1